MKQSESTAKPKQRAVLVGVSLNRTVTDIDKELSELMSLADTAGLVVVGKDFQNIKQLTPATLIGSGKVQEIAQLVKGVNADVAVFDCELSGSQIGNLGAGIGVNVIDRSMLILDIFAGRAKTNEGRLQVEIAQLKYTLPRFKAISEASGRFGSAGVGMRGPGETKLELDKRIIKENILKLQKQIDEIKEQRKVQSASRRRNNTKNVAIVGYTNAGKSTLMNTVTKAGIYADDKLFATLDTTTRSLWLCNGKEILLTDTVGFIDKLPHAFIEAFSATLSEARDADLLLHVVDITNPEYKKQIEVVNKVLKELGADKIPVIMVYNKADAVKDKQCLYYCCGKTRLGPARTVRSNKDTCPPAPDTPFNKDEFKDGVIISAKKNKGIDELKAEIAKVLF